METGPQPESSTASVALSKLSPLPDFRRLRHLFTRVLPFLAAGACDKDTSTTQIVLCTSGSFSDEGEPGIHDLPENLEFGEGSVVLKLDAGEKTVELFAKEEWRVFPPIFPDQLQKVDWMQPEVIEVGVKKKGKKTDRLLFKTKETYEDIPVFGTVDKHYDFEYSVPVKNNPKVDVTVNSDLFPGSQQVWATALVMSSSAFEAHLENRVPPADEKQTPSENDLHLEHCASLLGAE